MISVEQMIHRVTSVGPLTENFQWYSETVLARGYLYVPVFQAFKIRAQMQTSKFQKVNFVHCQSWNSRSDRKKFAKALSLALTAVAGASREFACASSLTYVGNSCVRH